MRPLIGITTYREPARWGTWDVPAVLLPAAYADAVAQSGGEPVLLPTGASSADVVARLDGLVIAGGADVDPAQYDQQPGAHTTVVRPDRDDTELALLETALERDLPLLAIC
jgi:anthranilate synthase component 2/putative glutamine amidotransferase